MNETKRWKRGDVREDGMVFWNRPASNQGEIWLHAKDFEARYEVDRRRRAAHYASNRTQYAIRNAAYRKANREKIAARKAAYSKTNREKRAAYNAAYYKANKEKIAASVAAYQAANREKITAYNKANREKRSIYNTTYGKANRARIAARKRLRRIADPQYAIQQRVRCRTGKAVRRITALKSTKTEELLGCTWKQAKRHIEKQFVEGMSWDNRDKWHIDHVIPLSSAYDEYTLSMLCDFTNLKPVWRTDNLRKSNKYHEPEYCI